MLALAGKARTISSNLRAVTVISPSFSTATGSVAIISNSISVLVMVSCCPRHRNKIFDKIGRVERRSTMLHTSCKGRAIMSWLTVNCMMSLSASWIKFEVNYGNLPQCGYQFLSVPLLYDKHAELWCDHVHQKHH